MVKLSRQELEQETALDSFGVVSDEKLRAAMSYSPEMLDMNELFEKTNVSSDELIDLSTFPDIKVIQASSQRQLDMILPASKRQIESVHLSNDQPVGWDNGFNMENSDRADRSIDLTDYANIRSVETHFYLNTDLERIEMPKSVETLKFQHSKLPALKIDNIDTFDEVIINRSLMNHIGRGNISVNASIIDGESINFDEEVYEEARYSITDEFEQVQSENGMFELKVKDKVVLKSDKPFELQEVDYHGFTIHYDNSEHKDFSHVGINGEVFALSNNELYRMYEDKDGGIGRHVDKVIFENTSKDERIEAYSYLGLNSEGFGGNVNLREGYSEVRGRRDVGRGYTPVETALFLVRDGKVLPETICTKSSEMLYCGGDLYEEFMNNIKEKGIALTPEEKKYKEDFLRSFAQMSIARGEDNLYGFDKEMYAVVKDNITPEMRRNYILDHIKKDPSLIEFIPEMINSDKLSVKDLLTIKNACKQEAVIRHISAEVLKGHESAKDLLKLSLSRSYQKDKAIDTSNIPFLIRLSAQSGTNLSEENNIYGQLFDQLSENNRGDTSMEEAVSTLNNSVKTLLKLGVDINGNTLNNGYNGTRICPSYGSSVEYIVEDPAARLAVRVSGVNNNNKDALELYQLLIDNVKSQKDINNMVLCELLAANQGEKSAKFEILSPRATYEDIRMDDAISMRRMDVCRFLYEKGRKPTEYDIGNLKAHARGAYYDSEEQRLSAAEFIKFTQQQR